MKQYKNLVLSFTDEGGNKRNITIQNPADNAQRADAEVVGNLITSKSLIWGKAGHLKTYNGAFIITRTEDVL